MHYILPVTTHRPLRTRRSTRKYIPIGLIGTLVFLLLIRWLTNTSRPPTQFPSCISSQLITHNQSVISYPGGSHSSPTYVAFQPPKEIVSRTPLVTRPPIYLNCLDDHFEHGLACFDKSMPHLDVVWTWVNGTDPFVIDAIHELEAAAQAKNDVRKASTLPKLFRDHDELKHSIRSVIRHFSPHTSRFHLVTSDLAIPSCPDSGLDDWRLGIIPQWLNTSNGMDHKHNNIQLHVWHHAQVFKHYTRSIFHSYAVESQIGNIPNLSENFIYMNDDFFFLADMRPADFHTKAYGRVLRMQPDLLVKPHRAETRASGEWQALEYSNGLLSDRFGGRHRPYTTHQAKSLDRGIINEVTQIWSTEVALTASRPLRGLSNGLGDVYLMFLAAHYTVERWREGLLWSWVVGRIGGLDGTWTEAEAKAAWKQVGGEEGQIEVLVRRKERKTLEPERVAEILVNSGHDADKKTSYMFSSGDGYPYIGLGIQGQKRWPSHLQKATAAKTLDTTARCTIEYQECFAWSRDGKIQSASDVFKRVAFDKPKSCGDCIIVALVSSSGPLGLSSFLPPASRVISPAKNPISSSLESSIPRLPMPVRWGDGAFSLQDVLGVQSTTSPVNIRDWTLRMLDRYKFVIGETPSIFMRIRNPEETRQGLKKIKPDDEAALLCINDDVMMFDWHVRQRLVEWMGSRWPTPAKWEV